MNEEDERGILKVISAQKNDLKEVVSTSAGIAEDSEAAIAEAQSLLKKLGEVPHDDALHPPLESCRPPAVRPWREVLAEAQRAVPDDVTFSSILTESELDAISTRHQAWEDEFCHIHELNRYDYVIAGIAGVLAGLTDIFLVQIPQHPGFLGGQSHPGGWLSRVVKAKFGDILPGDSIKDLEQHYYVPYDASKNVGLDVPVAGLGPRTHRLHSLGHDPFLGWLFGVKDVMKDQFTAISSNGNYIVQPVSAITNRGGGAHLFVRLCEAFRAVGGHLLSDVATPAGLPPPFASLFLFLQKGSIGTGHHTVASVVRAMYRSGYDFRHFIAGSIPVMIIEVIVRLCYFVREIHDGSSFLNALPLAHKPRLRSQLFLAHSVAAAVNAGKVAFTHTPLAVNWAQWLAFFRYLLPQVHWMLVGRESARQAYVQGKIDAEWDVLRVSLAETWRTSGVGGNCGFA